MDRSDRIIYAGAVIYIMLTLTGMKIVSERMQKENLISAIKHAIEQKMEKGELDLSEIESIENNSKQSKELNKQFK